MQQISILGCGWLGLPLAKSLLEKNFHINGSTTSIEKLEYLQTNAIKPFLINLDLEDTSKDITDFLEKSSILIICIPPKMKGVVKTDFVGKMKTFISEIEKSTIKKVIFTSSTAVYPNENQLATEDSPTNPETSSGTGLLEVEKMLLGNAHFQTTIIRLSGLIGEDRHPVYHLSGRQNIQNPDAPINLIHQEDAIGIIKKVILTQSWNTIFNAVNPYHPSRKNYYETKAENLNLPLPEFATGISVGKTVCSHKVEKILKHIFAANL
jgi:nucleoside-diphosphate-sugar epimerase